MPNKSAHLAVVSPLLAALVCCVVVMPTLTAGSPSRTDKPSLSLRSGPMACLFWAALCPLLTSPESDGVPCRLRLHHRRSRQCGPPERCHSCARRHLHRTGHQHLHPAHHHVPSPPLLRGHPFSFPPPSNFFQHSQDDRRRRPRDRPRPCAGLDARQFPCLGDERLLRVGRST